MVACSLVVPSFPKPSTSLWLQAVEKFSANTQEISASLRAFTQKLQETEFPNDVTSTEELLQSQVSIIFFSVVVWMSYLVYTSFEVVVSYEEDVQILML